MQAVSTYLSKTASSSASAHPRLSVEVMSADHGGVEAYSAFCSDAIYAAAQSPLWISAWLGEAGEDGLICLVSCDGRPAFALALDVVHQGPFRIARFAGGSHANGNFPALAQSFPAGSAEGKQFAEALVSEVRRRRPDIDMLALERQRESLGGRENPLRTLRRRTKSPNISLAADLSGGFAPYLDRNSGKRKRKKHRSQLRKFEAAGGHRRFTARSEAEVDWLLDEFFMLRRARFERMGVANAFADPRDQASFRVVFRSALQEKTPPFLLQGLEVGGKLRAVSGSSRTPNSVICEFTAFAEDELAYTSPGEFLFYENIAEACAEGLEVFDFSVGDLPYKRAWCDIECQPFDVFIGLNTRGRLLAAGRVAAAGISRTVKGTPHLMRLVEWARKLKAGAA